MDYEELYYEARGDYKTMEGRCRYYREAYGELKEQNKALHAEMQRRVSGAHKKVAEELTLLQAQLRARNEEVAAFKKLCVEQQEELCVLAPQVVLLQSQVHSKDAIAKQLDEERAKTEALKALNAKILGELRRVNSQLSAEDSISEASKQVAGLSEQLEQAYWKHTAYETALKVLKERVIEMEKNSRKFNGH